MVNKDGKLALLLFGPPGAGKGTQARQISVALEIPTISTGDMFREALKNQTELGKTAKSYMESGGLVPDELVSAMVKERIARADCARGFILDGYPRTISQAEYLQALFDETGEKSLTIGIQVDDEHVIERLAGRLTCPKCGKMFHQKFTPSKAGENCDECGTKLILRKDDTAEVIRERLQVYHKTTKPLIQYYKGLGSYAEVDGEKAVDEIFNSIMNVIKAH
ncbi:MAG: adenylate kinase [Acidobacteria bacterium]|jgi:adenylate kinase|nr:adenylate kinase [Acidobacteriota bacterium]